MNIGVSVKEFVNVLVNEEVRISRLQLFPLLRNEGSNESSTKTMVTNIAASFLYTKKQKSTLPTQALSCSGSKGLSQPDQLAPDRAATLGRGTPGAFRMLIYEFKRKK